MDPLPLNVLVSAAIVIVGWLVAHRLSLHRDTLAKRRELRVQYLLEAYRRLETASNRDIASVAEAKRAFESAVADIQLLGTDEQVVAVLAYLRQHASLGGSDVTPVLELLRADLRSELALGPATERLIVFRFRETGHAILPPTAPHHSRDAAV